MRRSFGTERGQSTVEMALMLPVLLLLLIGTVDVGIAVNAYVTVTNAAREATQYAVSHPTAAPSAIVSAATSRSAPLRIDDMNVAVTYYDGSAFQTWPQTGLASGSPSATKWPVRVEVTYPWSASTILIGDLVRDVTFRGSSTMVVAW